VSIVLKMLMNISLGNLTLEEDESGRVGHFS
jgi:hypothetical protein